MSFSEPVSFEIRLRSRRVQRELAILQGSDYQRVLRALQGLAEEPRPSGWEKLYDDVYRIRVGDWRIIYPIDAANRRIDIGGVRRRSEQIYKGIEELFP